MTSLRAGPKITFDGFLGKHWFFNKQEMFSLQSLENLKGRFKIQIKFFETPP